MSNIHHNINGDCALIGCPQCKERTDKFMTKPLSEMLEAIEPKTFRWQHVNRDQFTATPIGCDYVPRASYDKLRAVAIELAKACEAYAYKNAHPKIKEVAPMFRQYAFEAIDRAKDIIGGE